MKFLLIFLLILAPLPLLAKPPHKPSADHLAEARALVDEMAAKLATILQIANAPGVGGAKVDSGKVAELIGEFQKAVQARSQESDALEKVLTETEKAELNAYIQQKITPQTLQLDALYRRLKEAEKPHHEGLDRLDKLQAEVDAIVVQAQGAGQDAGRQQAVHARLMAVDPQRHELEHALQTDETLELSHDDLLRLLKVKLDDRVRRVERLLRMARAGQSATYQQIWKKLPELTEETSALLAELAAVKDVPGLRAAWQKETTLRETVAVLSGQAALLVADEAQELGAIAQESLAPLLDKLGEAALLARTKLPVDAAP